jgi:hypothetical protein
MDSAGLSHEQLKKAISLLGSAVAPLVNALEAEIISATP